jgi:hypothetical protein
LALIFIAASLDPGQCGHNGIGTGGGGGGSSPYQPYYNLPPEGQRPPMLAVYSYCDVDGTPFCTFFTFEIVGYVDTYGTFNNYSNQDFSSHRTYSTFAVVHGANSFTPWSGHLRNR